MAGRETRGWRPCDAPRPACCPPTSSPGDVVADEIDQRRRWCRGAPPERFEHQGVDQHVIDGREVRAQGHVVDVGVGLRRAERRVDQFAIVAGQRNVPGCEFLLQRAELAAGQLDGRSRASRSGREMRRSLSRRPKTSAIVRRGRLVTDFDDFAFAEMVAAAVGAELARSCRRSWQCRRRQRAYRGGLASASSVSSWPTWSGIFAAAAPMLPGMPSAAQTAGDAPSTATSLPTSASDMAALLHRPLAAAGAGRRCAGRSPR